MYTAMALVALTLGVTTGNVSGTPAWLDDYQVAQTRVADVGKPMVVVVGSGQAGWQDVVRGGGFDPAVAKLLADKFVCLYVDTTTAKGRELADSLRVRQGVVISDKTGKSQAFNASGTVSRTELVAALTRYADQPEVTRTEFQTTTTTAPQTTTVQGGTVIQGGPMGGTVIQGGTVMPAQGPVYMGSPAGYPAGGYAVGGAYPAPGGYAAGCCPTGGYGGGYAMGGGCCGGGYAMGGCGGVGHKCCGLFGGLFGGGWGGGWGGGCGGGYSSGCGGCGGGKFGGLFGGMFGGWGGGGYGGGCCH